MQGDFATFDFPITADLETLLAKDINGLYYCRLVAASMAFVDVQLLLLCLIIFPFYQKKKNEKKNRNTTTTQSSKKNQNTRKKPATIQTTSQQDPIVKIPQILTNLQLCLALFSRSQKPYLMLNKVVVFFMNRAVAQKRQNSSNNTNTNTNTNTNELQTATNLNSCGPSNKSHG